MGSEVEISARGRCVWSKWYQQAVEKRSERAGVVGLGPSARLPQIEPSCHGRCHWRRPPTSEGAELAQLHRGDKERPEVRQS